MAVLQVAWSLPLSRARSTKRDESSHHLFNLPIGVTMVITVVKMLLMTMTVMVINCTHHNGYDLGSLHYLTGIVYIDT